MANLSVDKVPLYTPSLDEISNVLQNGLTKNFSEVEVSVVECPDLRQEPFFLNAQGIGGSPRILDIGGVPYLLPTPNREKIYNMDTVAKLAELPGAFLIGAGAGPFQTVGVNCEMMANIKTKSANNGSSNGTYVSYIDSKNGSCIQTQLDENSRDFALMANLLASEGKTTPVLKIKAKQRIGELCFVDAIRFALRDKYGEKSVGVGGTFAILKGKARMHVMPDFSTEPLKSDEEVNQWLKFFNMSSPLICLGVCFSHDPGYELRIEHFHGFSKHGEGGHYHDDTTPAEVEYLGYFNVAEYLFRIDRPSKK
ncbi:hypothetical protein CHUAL_012923 [Chamberlinius hualienensis]